MKRPSVKLSAERCQMVPDLTLADDHTDQQRRRTSVHPAGTTRVYETEDVLEISSSIGLMLDDAAWGW